MLLYKYLPIISILVLSWIVSSILYEIRNRVIYKKIRQVIKEKQLPDNVLPHYGFLWDYYERTIIRRIKKSNKYVRNGYINLIAIIFIIFALSPLLHWVNESIIQFNVPVVFYCIVSLWILWVFIYSGAYQKGNIKPLYILRCLERNL